MLAVCSCLLYIGFIKGAATEVRKLRLGHMRVHYLCTVSFATIIKIFTVVKRCIVKIITIQFDSFN